MIVAVPYVEGMLHPRVVPAIDRQNHAGELWRVDPPPYNVFLARCFGRMATKQIDVAIVEQDVESRTGALQSFEDCPLPYCFHAYKFNTAFDDAALDHAPLGHTRFRFTIAPHLRELTLTEEWRTSGYLDLDRLIGRHLRGWGILPHRHEGDVIHHHAYD